jgi:transposase-like protein
VSARIHRVSAQLAQSNDVSSNALDRWRNHREHTAAPTSQPTHQHLHTIIPLYNQYNNREFYMA